MQERLWLLNIGGSIVFVHSWPDPMIERCNGAFTFDGARDVGEERTYFAVIGSVTPIISVYLAIFGSLCNQIICNWLPLRNAITSDTHLVGMWHLCQELFCGRGTWRLKDVMRLLKAKNIFLIWKSVKRYLPFHFSSPLHEVVLHWMVYVHVCKDWAYGAECLQLLTQTISFLSPRHLWRVVTECLYMF